MARFGTGNDLKIYHNGTDGYIDNEYGYLYLNNDSSGIRLKSGNSWANGKMAAFYADGAVELYYDNSKKLETSSTGVNVTGQVISTGNMKIQSAYPRFYLTDTDNNDDFSFINNNGNLLIYNDTADAYRIKIDGTNTFFTTDLRAATDSSHDIGTSTHRWANVYADTLYGDGSNLTGINTDLVSDTSPQLGADLDTNSHHILLDDSHAVKFGNDTDLEIQHTGSYAHTHNATGNYFIDTTGNFYVRNTTGAETYIQATANGAVDLYHDNASNISTTSNGIEIPGNCAIELDNGSWTGDHAGKLQHHSNYLYVQGGSNGTFFRHSDGSNRWLIDSGGHFVPQSNNSYDIGTTSYRVRNIYTNDLHLSNEGHSNDVDGTWGDWTIQEGESDLFLKNNRSGKKYKFNLTDVS